MMKNIAHSLKGKNIIAKNFEELLEAYERAVEVIAYKENTEESFMWWSLNKSIKTSS